MPDGWHGGGRVWMLRGAGKHRRELATAMALANKSGSDEREAEMGPDQPQTGHQGEEAEVLLQYL